MVNKNGMKPYEMPLRTAMLTFVGGDYEGAEVRCRLDVPLGMALNFQEIADKVQRDRESVSAGELRESFQEFARAVLLEWNIQVSGRAIPADAEGILQIPAAFIVDVMSEWGKAITQSPLAKTQPA